MEFFADLKRYGSKRAIARDRHRDDVRCFKIRQGQLAAAGFCFLGLFVFTQFSFCAALCLLFFTTAERECRRMRACGRYWQCNRSIEVIGI